MKLVLLTVHVQHEIILPGPPPIGSAGLFPVDEIGALGSALS